MCVRVYLACRFEYIRFWNSLFLHSRRFPRGGSKVDVTVGHTY